MQTREVRTEWPAFYLTEWWLVTVLHLTMEIFILEVMQLVWSRRTEVFTMESGRNLRRFHKSALKPSRLVPLLRGKRALCPQEYYRSSCPRFKIRLLYIFEVPCSALISMFNALLEIVAGFFSSQILDFKSRQLLRSGFLLTKVSKDTEYDFWRKREALKFFKRLYLRLLKYLAKDRWCDALLEFTGKYLHKYETVFYQYTITSALLWGVLLELPLQWHYPCFHINNAITLEVFKVNIIINNINTFFIVL